MQSSTERCFLFNIQREVNFIGVLTELLKDKEDSVRLNAAACLGELMFYIAAQDPTIVKVDFSIQLIEI
jgi:hypothetical protein